MIDVLPRNGSARQLVVVPRSTIRPLAAFFPTDDDQGFYALLFATEDDASEFSKLLTPRDPAFDQAREWLIEGNVVAVIQPRNSRLREKLQEILDSL